MQIVMKGSGLGGPDPLFGGLRRFVEMIILFPKYGSIRTMISTIAEAQSG